MADNSAPPEDDLSLPRAGVNKMIKEVIPMIRVSNDARELVLNCCTEFIHLIASEANEICNKQTKKTISPEHVIQALESLGFHDYIKDVEGVYEQFKKQSQTRKKNNKLKNQGVSEEELLRQQQALIAQARAEQAQEEWLHMQQAQQQQMMQQQMMLQQQQMEQQQQQQQQQQQPQTSETQQQQPHLQQPSQLSLSTAQQPHTHTAATPSSTPGTPLGKSEDMKSLLVGNAQLDPTLTQGATTPGYSNGETEEACSPMDMGGPSSATGSTDSMMSTLMDMTKPDSNNSMENT